MGSTVYRVSELHLKKLHRRRLLAACTVAAIIALICAPQVHNGQLPLVVAVAAVLLVFAVFYRSVQQAARDEAAAAAAVTLSVLGDKLVFERPETRQEEDLNSVSTVALRERRGELTDIYLMRRKSDPIHLHGWANMEGLWLEIAAPLGSRPVSYLRRGQAPRAER